MHAIQSFLWRKIMLESLQGLLIKQSKLKNDKSQWYTIKWHEDKRLQISHSEFLHSMPNIKLDQLSKLLTSKYWLSYCDSFFSAIANIFLLNLRDQRGFLNDFIISGLSADEFPSTESWRYPTARLVHLVVHVAVHIAHPPVVYARVDRAVQSHTHDVCKVPTVPGQEGGHLVGPEIAVIITGNHVAGYCH